ncbi:hypothetical protein EDB83DRAFT_2318918 [Lactarius deliciosus]|nr:hypothetical protein EDB83DRAFT_2318918 [Lactarius deliciosus]
MLASEVSITEAFKLYLDDDIADRHYNCITTLRLHQSCAPPNSQEFYGFGCKTVTGTNAGRALSPAVTYCNHGGGGDGASAADANPSCHTTTITDYEDRYDSDYDSRDNLNETASMTSTIRAVGQRSTELHEPASTANYHHQAAAAIDKTGMVPRPSYPLATSSHIDVWTVVLRSFRDKIILPIATALNARLHVQPMLLILVSQGRRPNAASLTAPALTPSQGELAVQRLLKVVRSDTSGTRATTQRWGPYAAGTHSFLSNNVPRDCHGRIAHNRGPLSLDESGSDLEDDATDDDDNRTATIATATMVASGSGDDDSGEGGSGRTSTHGGLQRRDTLFFPPF